MFEQRGLEEKEKSPEEQDPLHRKIMESLERAGQKEKVSGELLDRLIRLERGSQFNEDARKIERGVGKVLDFLEENHALSDSRVILAEEHRRDGRVAALLHDIGKTGPLGATPEQQEAVVRVFDLEQIRDPDLAVGDAVRNDCAPEKVEKTIADLEAAGIDCRMSMRQFWDKHAQWTHDILEAHPDNLTRHARIIAGSHHIDHGINPYGLQEGELPLQAGIIGTLEEYVDALESRILIAVDQYEASIRRSRSDHGTAIGWVRNNLERFKNDPLMAKILDAVDELGKQEALFAYDNLVERTGKPKTLKEAEAEEKEEGRLVFYN